MMDPMKMRVLALAALVSLCASTAPGAFSYTGSTLSENFDGLSATTIANAFPGGTTNASNVPGTAFDVAQVGGSSTAAFALRADTGTSNAGGVYSYATAAAPGDRALGLLASGSFVGAFGVVITNNSGAALTSVNLSFLTEVYRSSTSVQNRLAFAYGLSGGNITASNYLVSTALTNLTDFDLVGPAPVTTNGALNPPTSTPVSGALNVTIGVGQSLFLRWTDTDNAGSDAGIAIDNFSFSAAASGGAVPEPASVVLLGLGLVGSLVIGRKRIAR